MSRPQPEKPLFLLTDNGSVRAESALALRGIADDLFRRTGQQVEAASLAHSDRIPVDKLGGTPARLLPDWLSDESSTRDRPVCVLPFFLGNRGAIVRSVEKTIADAVAKNPDLSVRISPFLFEEDGEHQDVLARAAAALVREQFTASDPAPPNVILVDHGSPFPIAAQVRNFVAGQLQAFLCGEVRSVIPASMERREGERFAFTDPLLSEVLRRPVLHSRPVILSHFFLLPGRHAGKDGDVAEICAEARGEFPSLEIRPTGLLGNHPIVEEALAARMDRFAASLRA